MGWGFWKSGVSGKCDIYSVVGGDTSLFLPVELGASLGNWPPGQETRLSQTRTTIWGTEGPTAHSTDTRDLQ